MGRVRFFGINATGAIRLANNTLVDGETITIGDRVYEWDNNASVTSGNILVTIGGTVAASITNLIAAINANKPSVAVTASADPIDALVIRLVADAQGANGNLALAETIADVNNIVSGANMVNGENAGSQIFHQGEYVVTALDVLATNVLIPTGLTTPKNVRVEIRDTLGVFREDITGAVTVVLGNILHDFAGVTDLIAGDRVIWQGRE